MIEMLNKLRQLGVGLHIDDFGKGYSSLSYLQQFPIDTLKVDYTFINHIGSNGDHLEIVKTILVLARELGVDTIAEGIETENQLNQLRELDCHYGQGYYLGKPMRPEEVAETLKSRPKPCIPIELNQRAEVEAVNQLKVNPNLLRVPAWRK
jgi:EAL domain-containing protein (putative c-di-GMP-specific phosphodiesterase class I)